MEIAVLTYNSRYKTICIHSNKQKQNIINYVNYTYLAV